MVMFLFFLLYPVLELVAAGILLLSIFRRSWRHLRRTATLLFVVHTALIVPAFVFISLDPYWYDNGAKEYLEFGERWLWALFVLAFFEPIVGPGLFVGFLFLNRDWPEPDAG